MLATRIANEIHPTESQPFKSTIFHLTTEYLVKRGGRSAMKMEVVGQSA